MSAFCLLSSAFIFFVACPSLSASGGWAATYGGGRNEHANSIQQTSDGGYIVAGVTSSFGAGKYDIWVLKLKSNGTVEWQKTYGGVKDDRANSVQQISDGGYIVAGWTNSFGAKGGLWVLKLNPDGSFGRAQDKPIGPSCDFIRDTGVSGRDSIATVKAVKGGEDSNVSPRNSPAMVRDTNASVYFLCPP